jgi:hypothetical protein
MFNNNLISFKYDEMNMNRIKIFSKNINYRMAIYFPDKL